MAIDPETVIMMPGYRVGFQSPADGSLTLGELFIEIAAPPRLWVGGPLNTVMVLVATAPVVAPINTHVPYVSQAGDTLTCTMGTWTGEPDTYAYAWALDGSLVGGDSDTYTLDETNVGQTATCVVSATNSVGTTEAPPSNSLVVAEFAPAKQVAVEEEEAHDDA